MIFKREQNLEKNFDRQGNRKIPIQFLSRKLVKRSRISRHGMSIRRVIHLWKILFPRPVASQLRAIGSEKSFERKNIVDIGATIGAASSHFLANTYRSFHSSRTIFPSVQSESTRNPCKLSEKPSGYSLSLEQLQRG